MVSELYVNHQSGNYDSYTISYFVCLSVSEKHVESPWNPSWFLSLGFPSILLDKVSCSLVCDSSIFLENYTCSQPRYSLLIHVNSFLGLNYFFLPYNKLSSSHLLGISLSIPVYSSFCFIWFSAYSSERVRDGDSTQTSRSMLGRPFSCRCHTSALLGGFLPSFLGHLPDKS